MTYRADMTPAEKAAAMESRAVIEEYQYGQTALPAMLRDGAAAVREVGRLRAAFRVNMLRYGPPGTSHEEIDALLNGLAIPTEYESKLAQLKEDFPNGI